MSLNKDETDSSATSSYSSAEATPMTSPVKKISTLISNDSRSIETDEMTDLYSSVDASTSPRKPLSPNQRSSSDGAMKALEGCLRPPNGNLTQHQRSRSDCDELIATTRARMAEKFDQLEQESGIKLKKNTLKSNESKDEMTDLNICVERFSRSLSIAEVKEQAYHKMLSELKRAQNELKLRDEEVAKLSRIREEVESELEDLTVSLFEEANNMVYDAKVLRSKAEKELIEAKMKIDVLEAEVQALKMLVLTSTPSKPNPHLHPQIDSSVRLNGVKALLNRSNSNSLTKKSPSNYELGGSPTHLIYTQNGIHNGAKQQLNDMFNDQSHEDIGEVDPVFHEEFVEWKKCPTFEAMNSNFMKRIYDEEIYPVFNFKDKDLTSQVLRAIEDNSIIIEAVGEKCTFPKRCALLDAPRSCKYRMKIGENWFNISQLCRNRIIAVCDLFCYLRYIERGLVKSSFHDVYWEIMRRRRNIALSKLGFSSS
jgi:Rab-3A-interacting protein